MQAFFKQGKSRMFCYFLSTVNAGIHFTTLCVNSPHGDCLHTVLWSVCQHSLLTGSSKTFWTCLVWKKLAPSIYYVGNRIVLFTLKQRLFLKIFRFPIELSKVKYIFLSKNYSALPRNTMKQNVLQIICLGLYLITGIMKKAKLKHEMQINRIINLSKHVMLSKQ